MLITLLCYIIELLMPLDDSIETLKVFIPAALEGIYEDRWQYSWACCCQDYCVSSVAGESHAAILSAFSGQQTVYC